MRKAYKYRLYPTGKQVQALNSQIDEARHLYNGALEQRRFAYQRRGVSLNYHDQAADLKDMRAAGAGGPANFSACQDVLCRLDKAFKAFFRRLKAGQKPGFPRFKSRDRFDAYTFPAYGDGCKIRDNGKLYIQGVGELKVKWHRQLVGKVKTVTICRRAGRWHVCFAVTYEAEPLPELATGVGVDVGLEHFAALSTGEMIANPRWLRRGQAKLRRIQRRVARRRKGSSGRRKAVLSLQRTHEHVASQRRDFCHKVARQLVDAYQLIAVENLNVKGMARGFLAKSVHDAGWTSFLNILGAKAEEAGRRVVKVNPAGTSQHCLCGCEVRKGLSERVHRCSECGLNAPRDTVSALLILRLGRSLEAST
jgi:putative transposase